MNGDWEAAPGEAARRVAVSVVRRGERFVATIELAGPAGERVARSVAGPVCADVVNGMALVTALALESRLAEMLSQTEPASNDAPVAASGVPATSPSPASPPPATTPVAKRPAATTRAAKRAAEGSSTHARAPRTPPPEPPPRSTSSAGSGAWHVRLGAAGAVSTAVGPGAALGGLVFGTLEWHRARLGVAALGLGSGPVQAGEVPAHFVRFSGRLEGCPWSWPLARLGVEPCATFELGALEGRGDSDPALVTTGGGASLWLAPGLLARVVAGFDPLIVVLQGGASLPLRRQRFGVVRGANRSTTFEVPWYALEGAVGLGVRF